MWPIAQAEAVLLVEYPEEDQRKRRSLFYSLDELILIFFYFLEEVLK